jgi:endonuclease III-like uncharacterized protein
MQDRPKIRPETFQALLDSAMDSRKLGGYSRSKRIVSRLTGREIKTLKDMRELFSSMLEEEAVALLAGLGARMPDLTDDTVHATVLRMPKAA